MKNINRGERTFSFFFRLFFVFFRLFSTFYSSVSLRNVLAFRKREFRKNGLKVSEVLKASFNFFKGSTCQ